MRTLPRCGNPCRLISVTWTSDQGRAKILRPVRYPPGVFWSRQAATSTMRKPMLTCAKCSHSAHAIDARVTTLIDKVAHLARVVAWSRCETHTPGVETRRSSDACESRRVLEPSSHKQNKCTGVVPVPLYGGAARNDSHSHPTCLHPVERWSTGTLRVCTVRCINSQDQHGWTSADQGERSTVMVL